MEIYTKELKKFDLPATTSILRKMSNIELKDKPAQKPQARILAGYEAGYYYVRYHDGIWLSQVGQLLKSGYKIIGWQECMVKVR